MSMSAMQNDYWISFPRLSSRQDIMCVIDRAYSSDEAQLPHKGSLFICHLEQPCHEVSRLYEAMYVKYHNINSSLINLSDI